jgi:hypothetical protein
MKQLVKNWLTIISTYHFVRKCMPFFDGWYAGMVLGDPVEKAISAGRVLGLYRSIFFWQFAPRKYTGGALLNLLGLQIFRYYFYNIRYLLRSKRGRLAKEIESTGVAIKRNMLSDSAVDRILSFYAKNKKFSAQYFDDFSELVISNTNGPIHNSDDYWSLSKFILEECKIKFVGEDLTGLTFNIFPFISILHYQSFIDKMRQADGQDIPHADVFYPSFKIFVYLNKVNEENGAFKYLSSSNRFSIEGAIGAYRNSLRHYFRGGRSSIYPTDALADFKNQGLSWISAAGNPGDAVLFNVQGIHRRGDFCKDRQRERLVLLIDFRQAEVPVQKFAANV